LDFFQPRCTPLRASGFGLENADPVISTTTFPNRWTIRYTYSASLNKGHAEFVKDFEAFMRGIIIKSISPEDVPTVRRLRAIEGYVDLGMFQEAEEELRDLDPAWFAFHEVSRLRLRVYTGLDLCG
jgi:hypothetical protein